MNRREDAQKDAYTVQGKPLRIICIQRNDTSDKANYHSVIEVSVNRRWVGKPQTDAEKRQGSSAFEAERFASVEAFAEAITSGVAAAGGVYEDNTQPSAERFRSSNVMFLDFDNVTFRQIIGDDLIQRHAIVAHQTRKGVHVWFTLDRPVTTRAAYNRLRAGLYRMFAHLKPDVADTGYFLYGFATKTRHTNQDAAPLSADGLAALAPPERPALSQNAPTPTAGTVTISNAYGRVLLEANIAEVRAAGDGQRHNTFLRRCLRVYGAVKAGLLGKAEADAALLTAIAGTGLGRTGRNRANRPREVGEILNWAWSKAVAQNPPAGTRTANSNVVSDYAREQSIARRDMVTLVYDRLRVAGFVTGDDLNRWRTIQRQLKRGVGVGVGRTTHRQLLEHPLFAGGIMPSAAEVNKFYCVPERLRNVTRPLRLADLRTTKTYRAALTLARHANIASRSDDGVSRAGYADNAATFGVSAETARRDNYHLRRMGLITAARQLTKQIISDDLLLADEPLRGSFIGDGMGKTYNASRAGFAFAQRQTGRRNLWLWRWGANAYTVSAEAFAPVTQRTTLLNTIGLGGAATSTQPQPPPEPTSEHALSEPGDGKSTLDQPLDQPGAVLIVTKAEAEAINRRVAAASAAMGNRPGGTVGGSKSARRNTQRANRLRLERQRKAERELANRLEHQRAQRQAEASAAAAFGDDLLAALGASIETLSNEGRTTND